jgi:chaperonin cofactor prefoldin
VSRYALSERKPEWEAELSFLRRQKSVVERRIEELEDMLRTFFPKEAR